MRQKKKRQKYPEDLIPTLKAAHLLGVSPSVLQMRRRLRMPPRYYKLSPGRHTIVRYSQDDVISYLNRCLKEPDMDNGSGVDRG